MTYVHILVLAVLQGLCELLPVSSSAHVIVAEKLMGLDPSTPAMSLLLVMLHTGTMGAVIVYFWRTWRETYFSSAGDFRRIAVTVAVATVLTMLLGLALKVVIEKVVFAATPDAEIEQLFSNLGLVAAALAVVGVLILLAGGREERNGPIGTVSASVIGAVQGLCLPFRGFSRSGATISTGLLLGCERRGLEAFSFALAVILTPPIIGREVLRVAEARADGPAATGGVLDLVAPSLFGMAAAFVAGLLALRWLSAWLEGGRWQYFGYYCLIFSAVVAALYVAGV